MGVLDAVGRIDGQRDHAEVRRRRLVVIEGRARILVVRVVAGHGRRLEPAPLGLLLRGALGVGDEAQALVRDRRTAHHADPVGPLLQPSLRPLDGGELLAQLLESALVALALVLLGRRVGRVLVVVGELAGRLAFLGGEPRLQRAQLGGHAVALCNEEPSCQPLIHVVPRYPYMEPVIGSGTASSPWRGRPYAGIATTRLGEPARRRRAPMKPSLSLLWLAVSMQQG